MFRGFTSKGWVSLLLVMALAAVLLGLSAERELDVAAGNEGGLPALAAVSLPDSRASLAAADVTAWPVASGSVDSVTYSFRYPSTWNSNLIYCAPGSGSGNSDEGGHLPKGCASTDILVGQKARDVGTLSGSVLTIDGKSARRAISSSPANVLVSRTYTVMVYNASGAPLFGLTTQVGAGTGKATLDSITATLDTVASTIKVEAGR